MYVGVFVEERFVSVGACCVGVYAPRGYAVVGRDVSGSCGKSGLVAAAGVSIDDFEYVDTSLGLRRH